MHTWGDFATPEFRDTVLKSRQNRQVHWTVDGLVDRPPPGAALAVSGEGANGAFGDWLRCDWSEKRDRPEFGIVTGISTGAMIAPFALLGPKYDSMLRDAYTTMSKPNVLEKRSVLTAVFNDALVDDRQLWKLMSQHVGQKMLDAITAEYDKGRFLLIGTVNLDTRRSVVWNIGAIAKCGHPRALELVHNIVVESASIPAAFPSVMIDVEVDGQQYQEMHVDGGGLNVVFLCPISFPPLESAKGMEIKLKRQLHIIRNSRLHPDWASVKPNTVNIAARAISAHIHSQGDRDLNRMFMTARRDGINFHLAYIPESDTEVAKKPFDQQYKRKLL